MNLSPFNVAIVGAGPGGASLACMLSKAGVKVLLLHSPETAEKHCGGGMPARVFDEFPWLEEAMSCCREIHRITLISPHGRSCDLDLARPMRTVLRAGFDDWLRGRARLSGTRIVNERVRSVRREGFSWRIFTDASEYRASFLVGADGATSLVRRTLSKPFIPSSFSLCAGYYFTPPDEERIIIGLLAKRAAYAWMFPRPGPASAGIVAPLAGSNRHALLGELRSWLDLSFPGFSFDYSRPYCALVSAYTRGNGDVCGDGWALLGDAAGVADPITREGIYFSLKSAEIFSSALLSGHPEDYGRALIAFLTKHHRAALLLRSSVLAPFFTERAIRLIKSNASAKRQMERFFSGPLSYAILSRVMLASIFA